MSDQRPAPTADNRALVTMLIITGSCLALIIVAAIVLAVVWGGTAAAIALSVVAALIGVAALAFARYAGRLR